MYGKWVQKITTSIENTTSGYKNYSINFKLNGDL